MGNDLIKAIESAKKFGFNQSDIDENKLIHFCWFGGGVLTDLNLMCINSWLKYMPDYTYCLWDEESFDVTQYEFTKDAYDNKKWAFISDFVRLYSIYNYGGIYFDTDVELLKSISHLPKNFFAIEEGHYHIALGLGFAAEKKNPIIKDLLNTYNDLKFTISCTIPIIVMEYLWKKGYRMDAKNIHHYSGFTIYPPEYFCPKSHMFGTLEITDKSLSIHHYEGSWLK